jgi:hypothetical protein
MISRVDDLAQRIMSITWEPSYDHEKSRVHLMKEYLRRAAWWADATNSDWYPFFDIAAAVDPTVRADGAVVEQVSVKLSRSHQDLMVTRACVNALHFAAVLDAGVPLPDAPELPYEPLLMMFERGEGFRQETGFLDVDTVGVRIGKLEDNLRAEPYVDLNETVLDTLDLLPRNPR